MQRVIALRVLSALALVACGAAFAVGPMHVAFVVGVVALWRFVVIRRRLAPSAGMATLVAGAMAVPAGMYAGLQAGPVELGYVLGASVCVVFASRVLAAEFASASPPASSTPTALGGGAALKGGGGVVADLAATLTAAVVCGVLAGHIALVRRLPRFGFRSAVVLLCIVAGFAATRRAIALLRLRSWVPDTAGIAVAGVAGIVAGAVVPVLGAGGGLVLGVVVGLAMVAASATSREGPLGGFDLAAAAGAAGYWTLRVLVT